MDAFAALSGYDSPPGSPRAKRKPVAKVPLPGVVAAPSVETAALEQPVWKGSDQVINNPRIEQLVKPMQGPIHPNAPDGLTKGKTNHRLGSTEDLHLDDIVFANQYNTFNRVSAKLAKDAAPKRRKLEGTFAGFETVDEVNEVHTAQAAERRKELADAKPEENQVMEVDVEDAVTSQFHGKNEKDYQGRAWCAAPQHQKEQPDMEDHKCFFPKKWIHSWVGHTMGINAIRFFPDSQHLLLSCSMDSTIRIWDYYNNRKCMRTYTAHAQAVRDVQFTNDGKHFYSASFDSNICYWDTETGQVVTTLSNKKTPYCVAVNPDISKQHMIITGCSNKKAVEWDVREGKIVQEYDEHLGAVNTVTFMDDGKRIVTTSDDKKIYVWEYGIPVVTKHIAEPTMHSVPAVTVHPSNKWWAGQSMDNTIIVYEAFGKFKFMGRKKYIGHMNAGYAIQPGFSADGRYIMSGDCDGKLWFWDWKTLKNLRTIKAHDGVLIAALWHNTQPSRVVTAGWDGLIKLWD